MESSSNYVDKAQGHRIMGPWSEETQIHRADSIKRLLENNPQMDEYMTSIWMKHAKNLAQDEDEYYARVKQIYSTMKPINKGWVTYE